MKDEGFVNTEKKKPGLREILSSAVLIGFIGVFFVLNIVIPVPKILLSERRVPAKFPDLTINAVVSGEFMGSFEDYAADRFVWRDTFRGIRAFQVFEIFRQTDKSGLYRSSAVGIGEFRRVNTTSFRQTSERIKKAAESLDSLGMKIYYSIVPDKSVYAERYMPGFNLGIVEPILLDVLRDYDYIPVAEQIEGGSFYRTDLHWDQSRISVVANHLLSAMDADPFSDQYPEVIAGEFRGVYAGQLALPIPADTLTYIDVPGLKVSYLNEKTLVFDQGIVYDQERFTGVDPYDIFLRGPQPLIVIENDNAPERELYLFRDSFGSSLAPLLTDSYSKITVIDLRYINLAILNMFIEFTPGSDVLFIYSSQIFNNPSVLQTQ